MLELFHKPFKLLFGVALITLLFALLCSFYLGNFAIDIARHDTYYVVTFYHLVGALGIFYGLLGGIYWLFRKVRLVLILNFIHLFLSIFCPLVIFYSLLPFQNEPPRRYYSFQTFTNTDLLETLHIWIFLFSASPFIMILNILISLFRKE